VVHEAARPGDVQDSLADVSLAWKLLSYRPRVELRQGLIAVKTALLGRCQRSQVPRGKGRRAHCLPWLAGVARQLAGTEQQQIAEGARQRGGLEATLDVYSYPP